MSCTGILQNLDHGLWTGLWTQLVTTIANQLVQHGFMWEIAAQGGDLP